MNENGRSNELRIQLRGRRFEMEPLLPKVKAGYQELVVGVKWGVLRGIWEKVVVKEFAYADGTSCGIDPSEVAFKEGDETDRSMSFKLPVSKDTECKFTVELHQASPAEVIAIDPVIILKPGP